MKIFLKVWAKYKKLQKSGFLRELNQLYSVNGEYASNGEGINTGYMELV